MPTCTRQTDMVNEEKIRLICATGEHKKKIVIKMEEKKLWNFFTSAVTVLQTLVVALGAGLGYLGSNQLA
mgnify:CR=1 FL=1